MVLAKDFSLISRCRFAAARTHLRGPRLPRRAGAVGAHYLPQITLRSSGVNEMWCLRHQRFRCGTLLFSLGLSSLATELEPLTGFCGDHRGRIVTDMDPLRGSVETFGMQCATEMESLTGFYVVWQLAVLHNPRRGCIPVAKTDARQISIPVRGFILAMQA